MSEQYYKPCRELESCNLLIEKYFNTHPVSGNRRACQHRSQFVHFIACKGG